MTFISKKTFITIMLIFGLQPSCPKRKNHSSKEIYSLEKEVKYHSPFTDKTKKDKPKKSKEKEKTILIIGGYTKHIVPNQKQSNVTLHEGFNNRPIIVGIPLNNLSHLMLGTLLNTHNERAAFIGYKRALYHFNRRLSIEGIYAYVGEFFFDTFSNVGNTGDPYTTFKRYTGIGFAPYIYHGIEYDITNFLSMNAGFIVPFIGFINLQLKL